MKTICYLVIEHSKLEALIFLIFSSLIIGFVAGWFLHVFINRDRKVERPAFQFFHKEKLYNFNDAFIFLQWHHGDESQNHSYLVKFPDMIYFKIEFHNYGIPPEVNEFSKEQMIKIFRDKVEIFPNEAFAALKLLEA
jgi:hypothetical protein